MLQSWAKLLLSKHSSTEIHVALPIRYSHLFSELLQSPHFSAPQSVSQPHNLSVCLTILPLSRGLWPTSHRVKSKSTRTSLNDVTELKRKWPHQTCSFFQNQEQNYSSSGFSRQVNHPSTADCNWLPTASSDLDNDFTEVCSTSLAWQIKPLVVILIYSIPTNEGLKFLIRGQRTLFENFHMNNMKWQELLLRKTEWFYFT